MLEINKEIDTLRLAINKTLDPQNRAELGQFFTPSDIAVFMASLFAKIEGNISLLEPGVGIGSLIVAFLQEIVKRKSVTSITIESYDVEDSIISSLSQTMGICEKLANDNNIDFDHKFKLEDFINSATNELSRTINKRFSHVIMNPPYKKINSAGHHRKALKSIGIETVNLYSAFVALAG